MMATKRPRRRWSASIQSTHATRRIGARCSSSSSSWSALASEATAVASNPALWEALASPRLARLEPSEVVHPASDRSWPPRLQPAEEWVLRPWLWARTGPMSATGSADGKLSLRNASESVTTHSSSACSASSSWSSKTNWPVPASTPKYGNFISLQRFD